MKNLRIRTSFSIALAVKCRLVQVTKMGKNRRGHAMGGGGGFYDLTQKGKRKY